MIGLLSRIFIKNFEDILNPAVRVAYGTLCAMVGVGLNLLLFVLKLLVGLMSGSIAITSDAFNNLSDAGSSVITMTGFKLSAKEPDREHPYGHGRIEYLTGLMVSMLIVIMGFELAKTSLERIFSRGEVYFSAVMVPVLAFSIFVKLYMAFYNKRIGEKINSAALAAVARDSISDALATFSVLCCQLITHFTGVWLDGYVGVAVAGFILFSGIKSGMDTISPLLGEPPSEDFINKVREIVLSHKLIINMHDLVVHNYGPGRIMISLHAEVPADTDMMSSHDVIDHIEYRLRSLLGCEALVHVDPIDFGDKRRAELLSIAEGAAREIDPALTIHDFRTVQGKCHTNMIFDLAVPCSCKIAHEQLRDRMTELISERVNGYHCIINIDEI